MKAGEKSFLLRMSEEMHRELKVRAALGGCSVQSIVEKLLTDYLETPEKGKSGKGKNTLK